MCLLSLQCGGKPEQPPPSRWLTRHHLSRLGVWIWYGLRSGMCVCVFSKCQETRPSLWPALFMMRACLHLGAQHLHAHVCITSPLLSTLGLCCMFIPCCLSLSPSPSLSPSVSLPLSLSLSMCLASSPSAFGSPFLDPMCCFHGPFLSAGPSHTVLGSQRRLRPWCWRWPAVH